MDSRNRDNGAGSAHAWIRNNALGLVAIFIALSGSAIAAQVSSNNGKAQAAKKSKRGPPGPAGPQGPAGADGAAGAPGTALAFAHVNSVAGGGIDGQKNVTQQGSGQNGTGVDGVACLRVTSGPFSNVVATIDAANASTGDQITASRVPSFVAQDCTAASNAVVTTVDSTGTFKARIFYVSFN